MNSRTGDFNPTSLAQVINTDTVNRLVVQTWLDKAGLLRIILNGPFLLTWIRNFQLVESLLWFSA